MPRYDKYEPYAGGFRAPTQEAVARENKNVLRGVQLNDGGRAVLDGSEATKKFVGVVIPHDYKNAGDILDVMTSGEIVEFEGDPGTDYFVQANGTIGKTASNYYVGTTVEATRLVVRFQRLTPAGG